MSICTYMLNVLLLWLMLKQEVKNLNLECCINECRNEVLFMGKINDLF